MDAVKFIEERNRMCGNMSEVWGVDAAQIVKNTEEWSAAHPRKTRQSVFLEQWPEAELDIRTVQWRFVRLYFLVIIEVLTRGASIQVPHALTADASSGCRRWSSGLVLCLARRVLYCAAYYRHIHDV